MQLRDRRAVAGRAAPTAWSRASGPSRTRRGWGSRSSSTTALPATMVTDPHRLRQVLKNLLSNAFKFTEQRRGIAAAGPRAARLERRQRPPRRRAEPCSRSACSDTGIGIRTDLQAAMFEAFAQADGSTARAGTAAPGSASRSAATSSACSAARSALEQRARHGQHLHRLPAARCRRYRRRRPPCPGRCGSAPT